MLKALADNDSAILGTDSNSLSVDPSVCSGLLVGSPESGERGKQNLVLVLWPTSTACVLIFTQIC